MGMSDVMTHSFSGERLGNNNFLSGCARQLHGMSGIIT